MGFFLARLETGRSSLGGSNEISLFDVARGHIAGWGGVSGLAAELARNVSPTRAAVARALARHVGPAQRFARNVSPTDCGRQLARRDSVFPWHEEARGDSLISNKV